MVKRTALSACIVLAALALFSERAGAQIATSTEVDGRRLFTNAEPPVRLTLSAARRATIYMPAESPFTGRNRRAMSMDRDGVEKIVLEAADRHRVDPALVRAVIQTESNWNPIALSRKGAGGLMQLIPTTAQRFGARDVFNPQQNVDAGVHYLKTLLERYNGNLDMVLAAYNAGEGAVDHAHGIPAFRETRSYVQKVQSAYLRPGSGHLSESWIKPVAIYKNVDEGGRIIFSND